MVDRASRPRKLFGTDCAQSIPDLPAIAGERAVTAGWARTLFAWPRFIDVQRSSVDFLAVERGHSGARFGVVVHGDEREAARFAGHAVHHQRYLADFAMLFEKIL